MGLIHIMERGGEEYSSYKKHLKMAKKAIEALCDLTEDMEDDYGYSERRHHDNDIEERGSRMRRYR